MANTTPPAQFGVAIAGTTAQRPDNAPHGATYWNQTLHTLEVRDEVGSKNYGATLFPVASNLVDLAGAGAPSNGTTGADVSGIGSLYRDTTAGVLYINTGTLSSPTWTKVGTQS